MGGGYDMTFDSELTLATITHSTNTLGDPVEVLARRRVLCDVRSVTRSEHYQAAAHGLQPEIMFVVNTHDYQAEKIVEYGGRQYQVMRTYAPKMAKKFGDFESIELICSGRVGG